MDKREKELKKQFQQAVKTAVKNQRKMLKQGVYNPFGKNDALEQVLTIMELELTHAVRRIFEGEGPLKPLPVDINALTAELEARHAADYSHD